jgi:hypothetical protein
VVSEIPKRKANPVSTGPVSVWELLQKEINNAPRERPENSITPEEFAAKTGYSDVWARQVLARNPRLKASRYRVHGSNHTGICYVPNDDPPEAA